MSDSCVSPHACMMAYLFLPLPHRSKELSVLSQQMERKDKHLDSLRSKVAELEDKNSQFLYS